MITKYDNFSRLKKTSVRYAIITIIKFLEIPKTREKIFRASGLQIPSRILESLAKLYNILDSIQP